MNIYTIDNDGYIVGTKTVGSKYIMNPNDVEGEAPFSINHHHETGEEKPKSQDEVDAERISELRQIIPDKQLCGLDVTDEQKELRDLLGLS